MIAQLSCTNPNNQHMPLPTSIPPLQLGPDAAPHYALEGSIAIAGQGISWLRDRMGFIGSAGGTAGLGWGSHGCGWRACVLPLHSLTTGVQHDMTCRLTRPSCPIHS